MALGLERLTSIKGRKLDGLCKLHRRGGVIPVEHVGCGRFIKYGSDPEKKAELFRCDACGVEVRCGRWS